MPASFKKGKVTKQSVKTKMLCPKCGHDDFHVIENRAAWLLGEKFRCSKCGGTFKKANVVKMHEKVYEFQIAKKVKHKPKHR